MQGAVNWKRFAFDLLVSAWGLLVFLFPLGFRPWFGISHILDQVYAGRHRRPSTLLNPGDTWDDPSHMEPAKSLTRGDPRIMAAGVRGVSRSSPVSFLVVSGSLIAVLAHSD